MIIRNSYIFLKKEEKKGQNSSHESIINLLKKAFLINPEDINRDGYFKKLINTKILIDDKLIVVNFKINEVINISYLDVIVEYNSKPKAIKCMEYIHSIINGKDNPFDNNYICIVSYDSISEYYCNKIYPKFNLFERKLRNIMFNIYIVNFGKEFLNMTTDEDLKKDINQKVLHKVSDTVKPKDMETLLKSTFYSLDYSDMQKFLFENRWTRYDEETKEKFLENHGNLSTLSDEALRAAYKEISPKSDWNRFFAEKIHSESIKDDMELIRVNRNKVAHCKFFYFEDYQKCNKILNKLIKDVNKAIAITEEKDFSEKNMEYLKESFRGVSETMGEFLKSVSESMKPFREYLVGITYTCKTFGQMLSQNLYKTIEVPKISLPMMNYFNDNNDAEENFNLEE